MSYTVRLTTRAAADVRSIFRYIVERSPQGAANWNDAYEAAIERLENQPLLCGLAAENEGFDIGRFELGDNWLLSANQVSKLLMGYPCGLSSIINKLVNLEHAAVVLHFNIGMGRAPQASYSPFLKRTSCSLNTAPVPYTQLLFPFPTNWLRCGNSIACKLTPGIGHAWHAVIGTCDS